MAVWIPRPSPHSVREFVFQIVTIITGILIALAIDGLVEVRRHRAIVSEARRAIEFEITENLRDLEGTFPSLDAHNRGLKNALRFVDDVLSKGASDTKFEMGLATPSLNRASWQTADRTGALGYMEYAEVKRYSEMYELQELVVESQKEYIARLSGLSLLYLMGDPDQRRARPEDLETMRLRLIESMGAMGVHRSLARQLADRYKQALKR